jgi:catechol 2,3-dioxygenase-like lactoylglutathione lyase family enzyme
MLADFKLMAFLATTDAARARAFYEGVLGLSFVSEDDFAVVYDIRGIELRLQKVRELKPQPHTALGWSVAGIDQAVRDIAARGGQFERFPQLPQDPLGVWVSPSGARIAWLCDPDGNLLSLTERPGPQDRGLT